MVPVFDTAGPPGGLAYHRAAPEACHLARPSPCAPTPPTPAATGTAAPAPCRHAARCGWPPPAPVVCCAPARPAAAAAAATASTSTRGADGRPIALHPAEVSTAHVAASCRWHLSSGIAHPHGDGSAWCRIPHAVFCPQRTPVCRISLPALTSVRRQLVVRTRRLIDTGAFTPVFLPAREAPAGTGRLVVRMLLGHYLAEGPVETIRCVAQTSHRHRCPRPVLAPDAPPGSWRLLPIGQLLQIDGGFG